MKLALSNCKIPLKKPLHSSVAIVSIVAALVWSPEGAPGLPNVFMYAPKRPSASVALAPLPLRTETWLAQPKQHQMSTLSGLLEIILSRTPRNREDTARRALCWLCDGPSNAIMYSNRGAWLWRRLAQRLCRGRKPHGQGWGPRRAVFSTQMPRRNGA